MTFDPEKPVQTRDGRKARILDTDLNNEAGSLVAAVIDRDQKFEFVIICQKDGRAGYQTTDTEDDIINIPEKRWAVILSDGTWVEQDEPMRPAQVIPYDGRRGRPPHPIACLEFSEGDGL